MLVPAGGLAPDGRTWKRPPRRRTRYLVPVAALAAGFRGRFLTLARRALPAVVFPQALWKTRWVVFAKPVVQGADKVLDYLGRYVHRTAISDRSIVASDDRTVTFRYRDSRDQQQKTMTLPADELLRRFLQHVPPKGLHRVRSFGLLHPRHRATLERLQLLLAPRHAAVPAAAPPPAPPSQPQPRMRCPHCGERALVVGQRLLPAECVAYVAALAALAASTCNGARAPPEGASRATGQAAA